MKSKPYPAKTELFEPIGGASKPLICKGDSLADQDVTITCSPRAPHAFHPSVTSRVSLEELKSLLDYCPKTGVFTWVSCPARPDRVGKVAGNYHRNNGVLIRIRGRIYRGAILAWFYMTGTWPTEIVDHKDGDNHNNRWRNLREAPGGINQQNLHRATRQNKRSKLLGAHYHKASGKFSADITITQGGVKKKKHLGLFDTDHEAHHAYVQAKREFHPGNLL